MTYGRSGLQTGSAPAGEVLTIQGHAFRIAVFGLVHAVDDDATMGDWSTGGGLCARLGSMSPILLPIPVLSG